MPQYSTPYHYCWNALHVLRHLNLTDYLQCFKTPNFMWITINQTIFFFCMFHGHRAGLLFQNNLYAEQQTAEELLKPGTIYWHNSEDWQLVTVTLTVMTGDSYCSYALLTDVLLDSSIRMELSCSLVRHKDILITVQFLILVGLATNSPTLPKRALKRDLQYYYLDVKRRNLT